MTRCRPCREADVAAARRVIVNAGPLIAWLDAADAHHAAVRAFFADFRGELLGTWPVVTEVCHLLKFSVETQLDFLR